MTMFQSEALLVCLVYGKCYIYKVALPVPFLCSLSSIDVDQGGCPPMTLATRWSILRYAFYPSNETTPAAIDSLSHTLIYWCWPEALMVKVQLR